MKNYGWVIEFVALASIWGASFMFMHIASPELGALPTSGLRVGIAAIALVPLLLSRGLGVSLKQNWKLTFFVGILNSAIPFACFSYALLTISSGLSALINSTVPLFGALIAWMWLKDRPGRLRTLGLLIGFIGVSMLAWEKVDFQSAQGTQSALAILACLCACLFYGIAASFTKRYLSAVPSMVAATGSQIGAALGLAPLAILYWPDHTVSTKAWLSVAVLGIVCTAVAYILYFRLITNIGPAKALTVTFGIPVFALVYGWVFLGETVTPWMLMCGLIIICGTALSTGLVTTKRQ